MRPDPLHPTSLAVLARRIALALALLATQTCVHGDSAAGPVARPLLWTMERSGHVGYLLGTVHVGVDPVRDLPPQVWAAYKASPCFVMEADESAIEPRALETMATLPPGQLLATQVKPATWAKLKASLGGKLPPGRLEHAQPWFVAVIYMQLHTPPGEPMDMVFGAQAKAAGKRVTYLESWREALDAFAKVTTAADLDDLVLHDGETDKEIAALIQAYRSGDEGRIAAVIEDSDAQDLSPAAKKVLLNDRNALWLPRLAKAAAADGCFVAVGAAHLVGAGNLREQLTTLGFHITRAPQPAPAGTGAL